MADTAFTVLVVHHVPSPGMDELRRAIVESLDQEGLEEVAVESVPALAATADHVLRADAYVLLTPANFGYMSGALKHFFDTVYYPCLDACRGRPFGMVVHGNNDTAGAVRSIEKITGGLEWQAAARPCEITGEVDGRAREAAGELAAAVAANLLL